MLVKDEISDFLNMQQKKLQGRQGSSRKLLLMDDGASLSLGSFAPNP